MYLLTGDKVAQLVGCRTSNQRVAGSIPGHSGQFGRSWEKQFIPYCFSLPSCKLDANVHAAQSAPKSETAADVTN